MWAKRYPIGAILGFAIFTIAYISTVIAIFVDINKRMRDYSEVIDDDLNTMKNLGMEGKMDDINAELQKRLAGHVEENTGDDQLLGESQKLKAGEY